MQLRGTGSQTCRQNFEKSGPAIWVYCGIALIINERKNQPPAVQMHKAGGWFYKS